MKANRRRSWSLLVIVLCLSWVLSGGTARADFEPQAAADYQPVEVIETGTVEFSAVPVVMTTLFGVPPIWTYQQQVAPPPPPTAVVPVPPIIPTVTVPQPGTPQITDPQTPDFPDGEIVGVKTPEPATLLSGILGAGAVWYYRRRSQRRQNAKETLVVSAD